jgi:hypothetical protein
LLFGHKFAGAPIHCNNLLLFGRTFMCAPILCNDLLLLAAHLRLPSILPNPQALRQPSGTIPKPCAMFEEAGTILQMPRHDFYFGLRNTPIATP